ncbi:nicotinamide mononucleotide transporter PnuC family protein [Agrilactobacillus composti DSM 18527 = JCM 14202]|uniref:Nicotinamide mononucleotide transporter PnuC family protein n=1 Tax=Agrilactobacillus composti DSM 18527 = JCM 14202 TaxID=1423734 RepID=X0PV78_9LACO|nr:nicotinamide riboside transporter PnuC [Agrilactobacillus composti]KRM36519.1 nicotinamide mononucleotide transporter PnuC family protein [Agrilactobacillus composti DSM 18527 = JCM 14202]GAF41376.1 NrdR-regulated deoxyribonucleotide transporter, PnuC-like [Agrilactobacillus composti DSM 18527 = JCM 14202]
MQIISGLQTFPHKLRTHLLADWRGWTLQSYLLCAFGIGFLIGMQLINPKASWISTIAGMLGMFCVHLITSRKWLNGLFGLASAIMIIATAIPNTNYMEIVLQGTYIIMLDLPIILGTEWDKDTKLRHFADTNKRTMILKYLLLTLTIWGIGYVLIANFTNDARPAVDALSTAIGLVATWLCVRRFPEQYYFWFAQGVMSLVLWTMTALHSGSGDWALAVTYSIYVGNDIIAVLVSNWFDHSKKSANVTALANESKIYND